MKVVIEVDENRCIGKGKCYLVCPRGPKIWKFKSVDGKKVYYASDTSYCFFCKNCATRCPTNAI